MYNTSSSALFDTSANTLVVESLVRSCQAPKHNNIQTQKSRETRALSTWIASAATDIYAYTDLRRMTSGALHAFNRRRATSTYTNERNFDMAKDWCGTSRAIDIAYEVQSWIVFGFGWR